MAFRKRLEDQKKKQELANDTRVWWYEVSEARDKYTGQPKQAFWKEENPDYEYEEGRLCNVTYSDSTEPRANQLETSATKYSCLTGNSSIVFALIMITIYATWTTLCLCIRSKKFKARKRVRLSCTNSVMDAWSKSTKAD